MRHAVLNGKRIEASLSAPQEAVCPACGAKVVKRKRKGFRGKVTYFYRHVRGAGDGCPNHYQSA